MKLIKQVFSFSVVGGICFVIDFSLLILFTDILSINYLISSVAAFLISNLVNYLLSLKLVFKHNSELSRQVEFLIFIIMSAVGLVLTAVLMMVFVERIKIHYMTSKVVTTVIVMIYNFISRKTFFEKMEKNYVKKTNN